jgi:UDP-N-acetylmuramate dehydrogenase
MGFRTPGIGDRLRSAIGEGLREQEPLRHHTTFRVGGPADWFLAAKTQDQLVRALGLATELSLPSFLLGGGSNLLVSDEGFRGLVVKNAIDDVEFDGTTARVGCGADYLTFIRMCCERGLAGLAYAAGIPGSVGGALYGNAGCYGQDIGSRTIECTVCTLEGTQVETLSAPWFQFAYRDSRLKREPRALLSCVLRLDRGEPSAITAEIEEKPRSGRQASAVADDPPRPYFKNLPPARRAAAHAGHAPRAGRGRCRRAVTVADCASGTRWCSSECGTSWSAGRATAADVLTLAEVMKARVRVKFGVELEEEVMFLGARPTVSVPSEMTA